MSGPQCFENPPSISAITGRGAGKVEELAGLKTYITGPPDYKLAILLISDVFGYEAPNLRKLADKVATAGFLVVVPDFLYGDPYDLSNLNFDREAWRKLHPTDKGYEDAKPVIAALKAKGVSAIGAAGFCWGGKVLVKLASSDDIQAAVILHPGKITEDEIKAVKIPIAFLGAEIDHASPPEDLKKFGEVLSAKSEFESYVKIFPGVSHGWSVRYDLEDESAVRSAEEAHRDMLDWFRMVLAKLASSDDIQAAVILHPGEIAEDEIKAVKIPTAILGAENDRIFPAEELKKLAGILGVKSELESSVNIFPGVSHRWSVRYSLEDESAVESAKEAHRDMLDRFKRHVK